MKTVRVYKYACRIGPEDALKCHRQIELGHQYSHVLTGIELECRKRYRAARKEHLGVDLEALEERSETIAKGLKEVTQAAKDYKKEHRTKQVPKEVTAEIKRLRLERKPINEQIKEIKKQVKSDPVFVKISEQIDAEVNAAIKVERKKASKEDGLYWASYLQVEKAARAARSQKMDPKYRRWLDAKSISVQLQNGLTVEELHACTDRRLQMAKPGPHTGRNGSIRGSSRYVQCRFRTGSDKSGRPEFVNLDVRMHRALPESGLIKWATLVRRRNSSWTGSTNISLTHDYDYDLQFSVEETEDKRPYKECVAIEIGWRRLGDGLRVAYALGGDGLISELWLPGKWLARWRDWQDLARIIDERANRFADELAQNHPELAEKLKVIKGSPKAALMRLHRETPELREEMTDWRTKHLHLVRYKDGIGSRLIRQRQELYRCWVAELARRYTVAGIIDFDLRQVSEHDVTKEETYQSEQAAYYRTKASVSGLRTMIGYKLTTIKVAGANTTIGCHICGAVEHWDSAGSLRHTCVNGHEWDQAHNACWITLRRLYIEGGLPKTPPILRERVGIEKVTGTAREMQKARREVVSGIAGVGSAAR
jgi:hypothetical protein